MTTLPSSGRSTTPWRFVSAFFCLFVLMSSIGMAQSFYFKAPDPDQKVNPGESIYVFMVMEDVDLAWELGNSVMLEATTNGGKTWDVVYSELSPSEIYEWKWQVPKEYAGMTVQLRGSAYCSSRKCQGVKHESGYSYDIYVTGETGGCNPITIFSELPDQKVCTGEYVGYYVESDAQEATYEWYQNDQLVYVSRDPFYQIYVGSTEAGGLYTARVMLDCGEQAFTNMSRLTVTESVSITAQPQPSVTLCEGGATEFSVVAAGEITGYQWRRNGVDLKGETSPTLRIPNALPGQAGTYDVVVYGTCKPAAISDAAVLSVNSLPKIATHPEPLFLCNGASGQLSVNATGGNLKYQWYRNGQPVADGNGATLSFNSFDPSMTGDYQCVVTPASIVSAECSGTVYSRTVRVSSFIAPSITRQPVSIDGCIGSSASFVAVAEGTGLTYQWMKNGQAIPGETRNVLTLNQLTDADAAAYSVSVRGTCGLAATSSPASLTIITQPAIVVQAQNTAVMVGERIELSVSGTDVRSIQWLRNSQPIPGATQATFVVNNATTADAGVYNAILTNSCGSVLTQYARVRVTDPSALLPELTLTQNAADLGEIPVGYDKDLTLTGVITNTGNADMQVLSVTVDGTAFTVTPSQATPFTLAPGTSATVTIAASAMATGALSATLTVNTNAPMPNDDIALTAMGVLRYAVPALIDYAKVPSGTTKELCVDVTNTSGIDVTVDAFNVAGSNPGMFSVGTQPFTLAAGATGRICVTYTAGAQQASHTATLNIVSSTGGNTAVALQGSTDVETSVNEEALAMGMSAYPNPSTDMVTINTGSATVSSVDIVDGTGRRITTLDVAAPGLVWDGRDSSGAPVATGIYTAVVRTMNGTASLPIVVIR